MIRVEFLDPERPVPGADQVVPSRHILPLASEHSSAGGRYTLPLETAPISTANGWSIHLPVRAEQVAVTKDVVVYERVVVRHREIADSERVEAEVRREELRTSIEGEVDVMGAQTSARLGGDTLNSDLDG